jgi:hypothetical protein
VPAERKFIYNKGTPQVDGLIPFASTLERADTLEAIGLMLFAPPLYSTIRLSRSGSLDFLLSQPMIAP